MSPGDTDVESLDVGDGLKSCDSKYDPWAGSISIIWELVGNAESVLHPRHTDEESSFNKQDAHMLLRFLPRFWAGAHLESPSVVTPVASPLFACAHRHLPADR